MSELAVFAAMALIAVGLSVRTLIQVVQRWDSLWDGDFTEADAQLAGAASFYLLIPPTVLLHELGHALAVWAAGLEVIDFWFLGFMGMVFHPPSTDLTNFAIAVAGNAVTLLVGLAAFAIGFRLPRHPAWNTLWIGLSRQSLLIVLIAYPLLSLLFSGDFQVIFDVRKTPIASGTALVVHGALIGCGFLLWRTHLRSRAQLLCSSRALEFIESERAARRDPLDLAAHRRLALFYDSASDPAKTKAHLDPIVAAGKLDAVLRLIYGRVLLEQGDHARAIPLLEQAMEGLLHPEDRRDAEAALARAKAVPTPPRR